MAPVPKMTMICYDSANVASQGIWRHSNPLHFATPLLLLQISVISITSMLIDLCLQPLGQSSIVSQIFGGIVFGPSLLGREQVIASNLFPLRGHTVFHTFATFGLMFFFFQVGVKIDARMMFRPGKMAMAISLSVMIFTLSLSGALALVLQAYVPMDKSLASSLIFIACSQSLTAFPNIVCLLTELKILNTDLGRLAISSSMFCDVLGIALTAVGLAITDSTSTVNSILGILSTLAFFLFCAYVFRPLIKWIRDHTSEAKIKGEACSTALFTLVIVAGFTTELVGQHYILGPLVLGLAVPEGPPLGAALVAKLDLLISGLLYPTYLTTSGLQTNIFKIRWRSAGIVMLLVVFSCLVKIGAVLLPAHYGGIPLREAVVLGLMLNARGICELVVYNLWRDGQILGEQEFALAVIGVIAVTAIITPLIRFLYDPSENHIPIKRRTIQQAKNDSELRILVCIHNQENVPTIVNLLEASNPTEESPISVIALMLVELVGRATPMLIAHQPHRSLDRNPSTASRSGHIMNALHHYEVYNEGSVYVQSFSAVCHFETMHEDICKVARDQNASIVIVPFHKVWAIDGAIGSVNRAIQHMNVKVLNRAPCSVGILVDRGILSGSMCILNSESVFHVAVLYVGGQDDGESLAYGARLANHGNVNLTVIRFLLFGSDNARERKFDNDMINQVRRTNAGNESFSYQEEVVRDGVGLTASIRGLDDRFDLILAGRHHQESPLMDGLREWSECPELGVIGDMLASPDFGGTASVLVVQQQRVLGGQFIGRATKPIVNSVNNDRDVPFQRTTSHVPTGDNGSTWAISMDRS